MRTLQGIELNRQAAARVGAVGHDCLLAGGRGRVAIVA